MSSRGARVVRGFAAAGAATLVAALFHMAGGGQAPSAVALTLSLVFSSLASIVLVGKRVALWRLTGSVLLSQFLFHALFALSPSASFSGMPADGHLHPGMHLTLVPGAPMTHGSPLPGDPAMWVSHACAAGLTVVVLLHGERTLVAVAGFAFFRLRRFVDRVTAVRPVPRLAAVPVESLPLSLRPLVAALGGLRHRGPPRVFVPAG